ncbi:hypothetical protein GGR57DRAFT_517962 [Xylariaceae sp. FL1272]|nr:hypothetical protein GGR57DRAFT_517962 [Xylariaceae sp. FL1272]
MDSPPGPGDAAPSALATLWALLGITFVFVILRLYTRVIVIKQFGIDDHCYNAAFVSCRTTFTNVDSQCSALTIRVRTDYQILFLVYNVLLQISANFGFGRDIGAISSLDYVAKAILYEAIGQTLLVIGTAVAKLSMGLFLLRLVTRRAHTVAILVPIAIFSLLVVISLFVFWFSCQPTEYLWDRRIDGECIIDPGPVSTFAGALSVAVDFWYAGFPWYLLWKLRMPQREKIVIASSMSLGIVAAACGIKRALELNKLGSPNYLKDTVDLIVWHAAEIAVTMIGIGIPVCLPLYKGALDRLFASRRSKRGEAPNGRPKDIEQGGLALHTIGGTPFSPSEGRGHTSGRSAVKKNLSAYMQYPLKTDPRTESGESILGTDFRKGERISYSSEVEGRKASMKPPPGSITICKEVEIRSQPKEELVATQHTFAEENRRQSLAELLSQ